MREARIGLGVRGLVILIQVLAKVARVEAVQAFRFIEQTLKDRIEAHGGQEIDKDLFLGVGLVSDLDPCGAGAAELPDGNEMYLVVEPESAGYVVLGPTLRLLEAVHPRLPVTFFHLFTQAKKSGQDLPVLKYL